MRKKEIRFSGREETPGALPGYLIRSILIVKLGVAIGTNQVTLFRFFASSGDTLSRYEISNRIHFRIGVSMVEVEGAEAAVITTSFAPTPSFDF